MQLAHQGYQPMPIAHFKTLLPIVATVCLLGGCAGVPTAEESDAYLLIGFGTKHLHHGRVTLANVETNEIFFFFTRPYGERLYPALKKVTAGNYYLSRFKPAINASWRIMDGSQTFTVLPGRINYAGYWKLTGLSEKSGLAGIGGIEVEFPDEFLLLASKKYKSAFEQFPLSISGVGKEAVLIGHYETGG